MKAFTKMKMGNLAANKKSTLRRISNTGILLMGIIVGSVFVYSCGGGGGGNSANGSSEARIAALEALLNGITKNGNTITITGFNLQIVSGSGSTDDGTIGGTGTLTGLGNLIIGYNEDNAAAPVRTRTGSHNLVIGPEHTYSSHGGLVAGYGSTISARNASVSGGVGNTASGNYASVSGGNGNTADGLYSSVSGGRGCASTAAIIAQWIVGVTGVTGGCSTVKN